jgi:APA family basic amino acid/polyamine antiporter
MSETGITRRLSGFDTAMVVVSLVIGIGIFRTPAMVAQSATTTATFYAVWILGGVVSLMGALTFAEIGARVPRAGGWYRTVADNYHPMLAFMLNWSQAILQGAGAAGVAFIGAEYLLRGLRPGAVPAPFAVLFAAVALMLVLLALNWAGIRTGAATQNVLSLAKIVMIVGLALLALLLARPLLDAGRAGGTVSLGAFNTAAIAVFYCYGGYQCAMNLAGDVKEAGRNLPRAIAGGMLIVTALYLVLNVAYERVLGLSGVAGEPLVAAALARATFGPVGERLVSFAIFLSAAGFVNATVLQMPRSYYAMAEDGALPKAFLRIDPRTQTQPVGLAFFAVTMLGPALLARSFDNILNYVMFSDALAIAIVASTLFVLRRRDPAGSGFRMPGYPVVPAVFIVCLVAVALRVLWNEPRIAAAGVAIALAGIPLFLGARLASGRGPTPSA